MQVERKIDVNVLYTCESKKVTKWVKMSRSEHVNESNYPLSFKRLHRLQLHYWFTGLSFSYLHPLRLRGPNPISGVPDVKCKIVARRLGGRREAFIFCQLVDLVWWGGLRGFCGTLYLFNKFIRDNVHCFWMLSGMCPDLQGQEKISPQLPIIIFFRAPSLLHAQRRITLVLHAPRLFSPDRLKLNSVL